MLDSIFFLPSTDAHWDETWIDQNVFSKAYLRHLVSIVTSDQYRIYVSFEALFLPVDLWEIEVFVMSALYCYPQLWKYDIIGYEK